MSANRVRITSAILIDPPYQLGQRWIHYANERARVNLINCTSQDNPRR